MSLQFILKLSGQLIPCRFEYSKNVIRCRKFIVKSHEGKHWLGVTELEKQVYYKANPSGTWGPEAESKMMIMLVSDELLSADRLIFHSVAFLWNDKAWLLTAPSGIGKTTQYRNLKELYGEKIRIICGDNPVLHFREKGCIMVHPSPWNGKENFGDERLSAPMGGIIYLSQSDEDEMERMAPGDAVGPIFHEMNTLSKTVEDIHLLLRLEERMITEVPVWSFRNTGTLGSTELMFRSIAEYEEKEQHDRL